MLATGTIGYPLADGQLDEPGAVVEDGLIALGPRSQCVDVAAGPQDDVVACVEGVGDGGPGRGHGADLAQKHAPPGQGHQHVVGGAVQRAPVAEVAEPLKARQVRLNGEQSAGVHADQQRGGLGKSLPTLDLHPEVVVQHGLGRPHQQLLKALAGVVERVVVGAPVDQSAEAACVVRAGHGAPFVVPKHAA